MFVTYKYRIKDRTAHKALVRHAYAVNQVWNWCVAQQRDTQDRYRAGAAKRRWLSHFEFAKQCNGVGRELGIRQQTVQVVCSQFAQNRDAKRNSPGFRSSFGAARSRGWIPFQQQSRVVAGNSITYCGKTYRFFGNKRRPLPSDTKGGAFVEDARGRWYVCFLVNIADRPHSPASAIGIDLGLKSFATLSDGKNIAAPGFYFRLQSKLAAAQRSGNRKRTHAIHAKIVNRRHDFLHKLSTELARDHAIIAVGNVSGQRLSKTRFAKSVHDAGWSIFRRHLSYKANRYIEVDEKFTTQTCSSCGSKDSSERPKGIAGLSKRVWRCSECGETHDRDVNAARNILACARSTPRLIGESRQSVTHAWQPDKYGSTHGNPPKTLTSASINHA